MIRRENEGLYAMRLLGNADDRIAEPAEERHTKSGVPGMCKEKEGAANGRPDSGLVSSHILIRSFPQIFVLYL